MKTDKIKKTAENLLKENPSENAVHMTEDGQGFFSELRAKNHARNRGLKTPETFFREGHEPEDVQELEAELQTAKERVAELETVLGQIAKTANLEEQPVKINAKTAAETVAVVQLRETVDKLTKQLEVNIKNTTEKTKE